MSLVRIIKAGETYSKYIFVRDAPRISQCTYQVPVRLWVFSSTEIAQCPCSVAQHAQLVVFTEKCKERGHSALLQDVVSAFWAVTRNVSKRPHGLFTHVENRGGEQLNEDGDGTFVDHDLSMFGSP